MPGSNEHDPFVIDRRHLPLFETVDLSQYHDVDMMYNVGRIEGGHHRGLDLIRHDGRSRIYIARHSDEAAEELIKREVGQRTVPNLLERAEDYSVYGLTIGAISVGRTLSHRPPLYTNEYITRLKDRAQLLLHQLHALDRNGFGITLDDIAIFHEGEFDGNPNPDDVYMVAVPPFQPKTEP